MTDTIRPPKTQRPTPPERIYKTKPYTSKLLQALGLRHSYLKKDAQDISLRDFCEKLLSKAKSLGIDPDRVFVRKGGACNAISIGEAVYTEPEDAFNERIAAYESQMREWRQWDALGKAGQAAVYKRMQEEAKAQSLIEKRNKIKAELSKINHELDKAGIHI